MGFLLWRYTRGLTQIVKSFLGLIDGTNHYFSLGVLLTSFFAPWKRLLDTEKTTGFNLGRFIEKASFNLISRGIGAFIRFFLLWVGFFVIIISFIFGLFGVLVWVAVPFLGIPSYLRFRRHPKRFTERLLLKIKSSASPVKTIFASSAGEFVLKHTGFTLDELIGSSKAEGLSFEKGPPQSFSELLKFLEESKVWKDELFNEKGIEVGDLVLAGLWWDRVGIAQAEGPGIGMGKPGLGLELLFGYTPNLDKVSVDLAAPQSFSHRLIGRGDVVSRIERALTAGSSAILVGEPGVGKKTVVLEFARRSLTGSLGPKMAYKRVLEFDYNFLLSQSSDLNQKKARLSLILAEAASAGNIILVVRDIHRLTNPDVEGFDFTDVLEEKLSKGDLGVIAISTPTDYERFVVPNLKLRKYLEKVEVVSPTNEEAMQILIEAAQSWEEKKNVTILVPALRKILEGSDKYITETPFPEKALELLDEAVFYIEQQGRGVLSLEDVNSVLSEKTGIPTAKISEQEKKKLGRLEEIIHERLIDQEIAVSQIAKSLRARSVGTKKESRPVGSFLFLGPTGVGKTETAKVLARVYYGSEEQILRFDMAEYAGAEGLQRLIGSASRGLPGVLTTAIKNKPASLLLLDEIEKATPEVYNLFLSVLDEGVITDAFGKKINCKHLFVIGTSNAAGEDVRGFVSKGVSGEQLQRQVLDKVLEKGIFSPEFVNRFDGVVVFGPLAPEQLAQIARLQMADFAKGLEDKNIHLKLGDALFEKIAREGYEPAFGARPMRRIIELTLGDLVGKAVLSGGVKSGDRLEIVPGDKKDQYSLKILNR